MYLQPHCSTKLRKENTSYSLMLSHRIPWKLLPPALHTNKFFFPIKPQLGPQKSPPPPTLSKKAIILPIKKRRYQARSVKYCQLHKVLPIFSTFYCDLGLLLIKPNKGYKIFSIPVLSIYWWIFILFIGASISKQNTFPYSTELPNKPLLD